MSEEDDEIPIGTPTGHAIDNSAEIKRVERQGTAMARMLGIPGLQLVQITVPDSKAERGPMTIDGVPVALGSRWTFAYRGDPITHFEPAEVDMVQILPPHTMDRGFYTVTTGPWGRIAQAPSGSPFKNYRSLDTTDDEELVQLPSFDPEERLGLKVINSKVMPPGVSMMGAAGLGAQLYEPDPTLWQRIKARVARSLNWVMAAPNKGPWA